MRAYRRAALTGPVTIPCLSLSLCILLFLGGAAEAQQNSGTAVHQSQLLSGLLPEGSTPSTMLRDSLHREATAHFETWRQDYEARTDPEAIATYQQRLREQFIERIGGLPGPAPLQAKITGMIEREGYTVEKVLLESEPNFFVTAGLFLPDPAKFPPPWPAVIVVCGHSTEGKLQDGYQRGTALAALHGLAAMIVDPVGQGERMQLLKSDGKPAISGATTEHTLLGTGAILVGWNTARWMIGDGIAAIDYLQSRPDIQGDKIGCMGNSGGGTQTSYLMALDDRITAAAPSCYITSFGRLLETIGPQDAEQNIFGQIAWGMDHADYLMMRAPKPTLIACATQDFFDIQGTWGAYRDAKRLFGRLGAPRNIELVEVDAKHGWHPVLRQASVEFMVQHLAGRFVDATEPDIKVLTAEEMNVTPEGQVLLLPGAVSAFDHVRQESARLAELRSTEPLSGDSLRRRVRKVAGIADLSDLPPPVVEKHEQIEIGKRQYQSLVLRIGEDIWLPGLLARPNHAGRDRDPKESQKPVTCLLLGQGKDAAIGPEQEVEMRVGRGETVLAIDLRGIGETLPDGQRWYHQRFGANGGNATLAYLLGKSLVGPRAQDCLVVSRWLAQSEGVERVALVASGELAIPALHAAAVEPQLFATVELRHGLRSWSEVADTPLSENQVPGIVHAVLQSYDLPELAALIGERLTVVQPHDATDKPIDRPGR
jgi:dienelactone hydrolase